MFSPPCVWAQFVTTCIYDVQEVHYLDFYSTPAHLFVEFVMFREVKCECSNDGDIFFSLQYWYLLRWDYGFCPHTVKKYFERADPCLCCPYVACKVSMFFQNECCQSRFELFVLKGTKVQFSYVVFISKCSYEKLNFFEVLCCYNRYIGKSVVFWWILKHCSQEVPV